MFKPFYGTCICHNMPNLIVVRAGFCRRGNEEQKAAKKNKPLYRLPKTSLVKTNKDERSSLEAELDAVFSLYIRNLGAIDGKNKCYTCDKEFLIKDIQCGHFIRRRHRSLRWNELNAKCQCKNCNEVLDGNIEVYAERLIIEFGVEHVEWLKAMQNKTVHISNFELKDMIEDYTKKLNNLTK